MALVVGFLSPWLIACAGVAERLSGRHRVQATTSAPAWERDKNLFPQCPMFDLLITIKDISLLLKCSRYAFHVVCFTAIGNPRMRIPNAKRRENIQPVAVPLGTLPERRTMTIHSEISARGSLIPAGNGSKLLSDTCLPGTRRQ